jgi:hypothetical protein
MQSLSITQLYQYFNQLRAQYSGGQISHAQFVERAYQLQAQDSAGNWWTIDPNTGRYMTYVGSQWVPGTPREEAGPPVERAHQAGTAPRTATRKSGGLRGCLSSPIMAGLLSFGTAALWFGYTTIRSSYEGLDLVTPLLMGGVPFVLRTFQRPLDRVLAPLYAILRKFPRPMLTGVAFALPFLFGFVFTSSGGAGFGALRRSTIISVITAYVLTRRTEV